VGISGNLYHNLTIANPAGASGYDHNIARLQGGVSAGHGVTAPVRLPACSFRQEIRDRKVAFAGVVIEAEHARSRIEFGQLLGNRGQRCTRTDADKDAFLRRAATRHFLGILGIDLDVEGAAELARRSRGTPRIANRLLRRVRDYAEVKANGRVTREVAAAAMAMLEVDEQGFDAQDRKLLLTIIEKFAGGPVGVDNLSAAIGEERGTIEDVLEPYLIQQGFLMRTPRGRMATRNAWLHCGLKPPTEAGSASLELFAGEAAGDASN
jgi:hypothetical protein